MVVRLPPFHRRWDLVGTGIELHGNLFRRLDRHLKSAAPVGPHNHQTVAEQQRFAVGDTCELIEIVTEPVANSTSSTPRQGVLG